MITKISYSFVVDTHEDATKFMNDILEKNKDLSLTSFSVYPQYAYPVGKPSVPTGKHSGTLTLRVPSKNDDVPTE